MTCRDWRHLGPAAATALYEPEIARWSATLDWDTRLNWTLVEASRAAGGAPGFVVEDARGAVRGWSFHVLRDDLLQVGAVAADAREVTGALLDAILDSPEGGAARTAILFAFSAAAALEDELRARGFAVERYRYLARDLADVDPLNPARTWTPADPPAIARLFSRAYPHVEPARPFVRSGRDDEWLQYVTQLVTTSGCGRFQPGLSVVIDAQAPGEADAAVMVTRISRATAHFAQVAVDPRRQGRGLGRAIVQAALGHARRAGLARATLLVAEHNDAAAQLYARLGFVEEAGFVSAVRDQPRRFSSAALETGGTSTLR